MCRYYKTEEDKILKMNIKSEVRANIQCNAILNILLSKKNKKNKENQFYAIVLYAFSEGGASPKNLKI